MSRITTVSHLISSKGSQLRDRCVRSLFHIHRLKMEKLSIRPYLVTCFSICEPLYLENFKILQQKRNTHLHTSTQRDAQLLRVVVHIFPHSTHCNTCENARASTVQWISLRYVYILCNLTRSTQEILVQVVIEKCKKNN